MSGTGDVVGFLHDVVRNMYTLLLIADFRIRTHRAIAIGGERVAANRICRLDTLVSSQGSFSRFCTVMSSDEIFLSFCTP